MKCKRCDQPPLCTTMSRFNTDMICENCADKEAAHPKYQEAVDAEIAALERGERNFPGIGLPADLR